MTADPTSGPDSGWLSPLEALSHHPHVARAPAGGRDRESGMRYGFRVGDIGFLLGDETSGEVIDGAPIFAVPNTAGWFRGVVNVRGNLVPVFDLGDLLLGAPVPGRRLLVAGRGAGAVAYPIDAMPRAVRLERRADHAPGVPASLRDHVLAVHLADGETWLEIDSVRFLESLCEAIPA